MSPHSTCAPLYNGPPLDDQNRTFLEWKPLFVSQADGHEFTQFYLNKAYMPSDLEPSILSILDDDVQVDKLKQPELYSVADFTGDGLTVRHKAIATHNQSVKSATLKTELAKALSLTLRCLMPNPTSSTTTMVTALPGHSLGRRQVHRESSQYRAAIIPSSLDIAASDYDAFQWANHYMVKLSEVFLDDKQIWDLIRAISSNAKASGQPCSVASIDTAIKDAFSTRHLRSLALGEHGTVDSTHTHSNLNATVVEDASSPVGLVTPRSLPSYAQHK
ncbi:hypothetical protein H257_06802 [Aphanomyces astaci]|uniref:Uncharacterized protein n=1 Tax=Aphanomyces astaci TaxID=112090 RepID=W4GIK1_APHAT|nr:hypothetical protein H257_06802 [Aphanomyces astaci]ETV79535.1 hypothetical protein H257_06802 [Aphanomyces astaci]|eukprot:XP_009830471.1 hypothetical protein H257_06802 [Aphanomyces astaci]